VNFLAFWYRNQQARVRWQTTVSDSFYIGNGTLQSGVFSPYLFTRYIRGVLCIVNSSHVGCSIGGLSLSLLAYADDMILMAPSSASWVALQQLLGIFEPVEYFM